MMPNKALSLMLRYALVVVAATVLVVMCKGASSPPSIPTNIEVKVNG